MATLLSYLLIFLARALHAQRLLRIRWAVPRSALCAAILGAECWLVLSERLAASLLCCAAVALLCARPLLRALRDGVLPLRRRGGETPNAKNCGPQTLFRGPAVRSLSFRHARICAMSAFQQRLRSAISRGA